jgi:hypothetical protein
MNRIDGLAPDCVSAFMFSVGLTKFLIFGRADCGEKFGGGGVLVL